MSDLGKKIDEIIAKYTAGTLTLEDTNAELKACGSTLKLEPGKNELTEADVKATTVGKTPAEATGYGLLDTGTGYVDKVKVTAGKLSDAITEVKDGDVNMLAYVMIGGKKYQVISATLTEIKK